MQTEAIEVGVFPPRLIQVVDTADGCRNVAQEAMQKFTIEKDIAQHIKRTVCETRNTIERL